MSCDLLNLVRCSGFPSPGLPVVDTYIADGQSNMHGKTDVSYPSKGCYFRSGWLAPSVYFAREMYLRTGRQVYVVNNAVSGVAIDSLLPGTQHFTDAIQNVKDGAAIYGITPLLKGILFWQGETEAMGTDLAFPWAQKYGQFVKEIRSVYQNPWLPAVHVQLAINNPNVPVPNSYSFPAWDHIKHEQEIFTMPVTAMVKSDDISVLRDHVHPDDASYERIGKRMADAMLELQRTARC